MKQKSNLRFLSLIIMTASFVVSCTDLEIELEDSIVAEQSDLVADIEGLYNSLNGILGDQANTFALNEVTTDSQIVPTRGADWGDNGIWRQLHQHNWPTNHNQINVVWNQWNQIHNAASIVLSRTDELTPQLIGDGSFLRAYGIWVVLDMFGQVPTRVPGAPLLDNPTVLRGEEALAIIISDLETAITNLPALAPGSGVGGQGSPHATASKAAARYLLAKVLLNRHVYLGTSPDAADMQRVVSLVNEIENEGYGLVEGYFDIFRETLDNETIWFLPTSVGNRIFNGIHYNQAPEIGGGGWNGFSTLAEYYDLFEGDPNINVVGSGQEERRGFVPTEGVPFTGAPGTTESGTFPGFVAASNIGIGFLIGQQYEIDGTPLTDRPGAPLVFRRNYTDNDGNSNLINNDENTGARIQKYASQFGAFTNHEIIFRFADAHLMRAEALFRSGQDASAEINELRIIRQATPLGSVTEQDILDERGRELYVEHWRRNDLIRFGQYTRDWELKDPSAVGNENLNLFPIPVSQIVLNPNLTQNPGY